MTLIDQTLQDAASHAQLGLPVTGSTRLRTLKRMMGRLGWPFLSHQIAFNQHVLESLSSLRDAIGALQTDISGITSTKQRVENLDGELSSLRSDLNHISSVVERQDRSLMRHEELAIRSDKRFDRITDETELVSLKMDLAQTQIIGRVNESISEIQGQINRISEVISTDRHKTNSETDRR